MFSTIVVGIDGRPHDHEALALARVLADEGASVIAAAVAVVDARYADSGRETCALLEETNETVDRVLEPYPELEGVATTATSVGRGLRDLARGAGADLIITGSSRRGALGRIFAGDHVRDVLRDAPCPVAIAPVGYRSAGAPLERIGVGHDGSPEADGALRLAMGLRARDGAAIDLVEVVETAPVMATPVGEVVGTTLATDMRRARANLDRIVDETGLSGRIVTGSAAHELARLGRSADLIAVGLHHRGLVDRLFAGSTTHALLREQPAPVLVIPPVVVERAEGARLAA